MIFPRIKNETRNHTNVDSQMNISALPSIAKVSTSALAGGHDTCRCYGGRLDESGRHGPGLP